MNLSVTIDWKSFVVGSSIFVPCLNRDETEQYLTEQAKRLGYSVTTKKVIYLGKYGVRAWRTK
jgi:hypothetical protein